MFTAEQQKAISAAGDTLVAAGAGAGKTRTLVERCARLLLRAERPVSIREMLVVTFTEAAAAEVRERIRKRLQEASERDPANEWLNEQVAYLDGAHISTLHSFCYALVREHFYELDIDPAVSVMEEAEAQVLFASTLDELMEEHYAGAFDFSASLLEFIRENLNGWDKGLREFIRALHDYTQTRPNAREWLAAQAALAKNPSAAKWIEWHREAIVSWCEWWIPFLQSLPPENTNAHACARILEQALACERIPVAQEILARDELECWPKKKKGAHKKPFEKLFEEAAFLATLDSPALQQDWDWSRPGLELILRVSEQFAEKFAEAKRERSRVDFHDLEQFALALLWDEGRQCPTDLARQWRRRFKAVFVDEYQDINAAQDRIVRALSSEEPPGNRFLVGDIKQSIYRFRQADPSIFRRYFEEPSGWEKAWLTENFRSHEQILNFANPLFRWLMHPSLGGVEYDEKAALQFGAIAGREPMRGGADSEARQVELHLRFKDDDAEGAADHGGEANGVVELEDAEHEARLVAGRLREMRERRMTIHDQELGANRPVEWSDMVVLLRSAALKLEIYAKAFAACGVPLVTRRDAFYSTQEVLDLSCLLHILDNPLQDIPLVAVLRSPLVGLGANDLAAIRTFSSRKPFWRALNEYFNAKKDSPAREKIARFLERYHRWRNNRATPSLAARLELILADAGYGEWLLSQPRGQQRYANVRQLLAIARQFDETRGESLYLFLRHIEELHDAAGDPKPASAGAENAVRLMTIHQSKGLEFPVVAVADLGKAFNKSDQQQPLLIHEKFGICTMIKPPDLRRRYPSLPLWLARRAQKAEGAGEEMRVLYVALTRAQNHLLLFGTTTRKRAEEHWTAGDGGKPLPQQILKGSSALDWIGTFATLRQPDWFSQSVGTTAAFSYAIHSGTSEIAREESTTIQPAISVPVEFEARLEFVYPHTASTEQAAKTSVTTLRRAASEPDEESVQLVRTKKSGDGAERGVAMHAFLEHFALEGGFHPAALRLKVEALVTAGLLMPEQLALIDFEGVSAFWTSPAGQEVLSSRSDLRREFPITFRLTRGDLEQAGLGNSVQIPDGEFLVLQGVADLLLLRPNEIWLFDFKTDRIEGAKELENAAERYRPQLALYSIALASIFTRPVTRKGIFFIHPREFAWL
jgi:ATP-dependent helicase/nuclease subunit A